MVVSSACLYQTTQLVLYCVRWGHVMLHIIFEFLRILPAKFIYSEVSLVTVQSIQANLETLDISLFRHVSPFPSCYSKTRLISMVSQVPFGPYSVITHHLWNLSDLLHPTVWLLYIFRTCRAFCTLLCDHSSSMKPVEINLPADLDRCLKAILGTISTALWKV